MYRSDGRVSWPVKLGYAAGQGGTSILDFAFNTLLFIYYNQVLGLSGTYTGLGFAIALVFDAVADPAVGSWSDGFRSRWGRRHLFMAVSIVPISAAFLGLFWPPEGLSQPALFAWFTAFSILVRISQSVFNVPYLSLGAELSQNYEERTQIVSVRVMMGLLSTLAVTAVSWNFFFVSSTGDPTPQLTRPPYLFYTLASIVGVVTAFSVATYFTAPTIPHLAGSHQTPHSFGVRRVYADLLEALRNPSFRALFVGSLIYFVYAGTQNALSLHLSTFYWKLDTLAIQWIQYATVFGALAGIPAAPYFNRWLDKKWTVIAGVGISAVFDNVPIMLELHGYMPNDVRTLGTMLAVIASMSAFLGVQASITVASMMGDAADEHELKHGTRQEGVYFGSYNFASKCTSALGNMIAGFAVDLIGLDPNSRPDAVPFDVWYRFGASYAVIVLLVAAAIWVFLPYSLNRREHEQVLRQLAVRRANADGGGA